MKSHRLTIVRDDKIVNKRKRNGYFFLGIIVITLAVIASIFIGVVLGGLVDNYINN